MKTLISLTGSTNDKTDKHRVLLFNRTLISYISLAYLKLYQTRSIFDKKNVSHIDKAIRTTQRELEIKLANVELNELEKTCVADIGNLLFTCGLNNTLTPLVNQNNIEMLISRDDNSDPNIKLVRFMLAALCQSQYEDSNIIMPHIILAVNDEGSPKVVSHPRRTEFGCNFQAPQTVMNTSAAWASIYKSIVLPAHVTSMAACKQLFRMMYIDIMPSNENGIGLSRLPIEALSTAAANPLRRSNLIYHYIDGGSLTGLRSQNRLVPDIAEMITGTIPKEIGGGQIIINASLEADGDDVGDDDDDDGETPTMDDADPSEGEEGGADPGDTDDDPELEDDNPTDSGDDPDPDNPDNPSPDTEEPVHVDLLKINLELPVDETLDDILFKFTVARYIQRMKETGKATGNTLRALIVWKNRYLFLVSAKETKKFLTMMKHSAV